jgi:hypothetical protein
MFPIHTRNNPGCLVIIFGGLYAENAFPPSARTLVEETFPLVSGPPGNP